MSNSVKRFSELWSEHRFISFDRTPVFYRCYLSPHVSRGAVLVLHGMGEHGGRYRELTECLGQLGLDGYVPDLRGFGQSGGKRGCVGRFDDYFRDLDVVSRLVKQQSPNLPFFVLGHSFGGLVAASWVSSKPEIRVTGLVLTSPNFGIAIRISAWRHWLGILGSYVVPEYKQDTRVNPNFLTHDKTIFDQYKMDRLIHHQISTRLYRELMRQLERKSEIAFKLSLPVLVLQAGDDRVVSKEATVDFFNCLGSADKKLEVFPELYHEILNETDRLAIFAKINFWVNQHLQTRFF